MKEEAMKQKPTTYSDTIEKVMDRIDDAMDACVFRMDHDDELDLDGILVSLAEARVYAVKARTMAISADTILIAIENDQPRVYADELLPSDRPKQFTDDPKPGKLPKLKPQGHEKVKYKPGISKLTRGAISFRCPTCEAIEGTNCFKFEGPGAHPKLTTERNDGTFFHRKRQDEAKKYNDRVRKANILH